MSNDPFFHYLDANRNTLSQNLHKEESSYKSYERFPSIPLPKPEDVKESFSSLILKRESLRSYSSEPLSLIMLSTLLKWSAGTIESSIGLNENEEKVARRVHPSGGMKFPLELYIAVLQKSELSRGLYHYNIKNHSLEHMIFANVDNIITDIPHHNAFAKESPALIFFSFRKRRSFEKYGALAYKLAFIEAGHIAQNMYLVGSALGLACCSLGTSEGEEMNKKLDLDAGEENIFYTVAVGVREE